MRLILNGHGKPALPGSSCTDWSPPEADEQTPVKLVNYAKPVETGQYRGIFLLTGWVMFGGKPEGNRVSSLPGKPGRYNSEK